MATGKKPKRKTPAPRAGKKPKGKAKGQPAAARTSSSAPAPDLDVVGTTADGIAPAEVDDGVRVQSRRAKLDKKTGVLNVCAVRLEGHPYRCDLEPHTGTRHETDVLGAGGKKITRIAFDTKSRKIIPIA